MNLYAVCPTLHLKVNNPTEYCDFPCLQRSKNTPIIIKYLKFKTRYLVHQARLLQ